MSAITADAGEVAQRSFREVWVISLGHALTHWYPATFYLLLPLIGKELGLDYAQIGSILTAQYAAGAIANVPGGILVDTIGRKGLLMAISLCWIGIPYLLMGESHAYWMILGCATLVGIGNTRPRSRGSPTASRRAKVWSWRFTAWAPMWGMQSRRWSWAFCCKVLIGAPSSS
jgi:MFS transporter, FSR family, fosmidomycin resistance protein